MRGFYPTTILRKFHVSPTHSSHTNSVSVYPQTACENTKSCRRIFQIGWIQDPLLKSLTRSSLNSRSRSPSEIAFRILITRQDPHQVIHKDPCQDSRKGPRQGPLLARATQRPRSLSGSFSDPSSGSLVQDPLPEPRSGRSSEIAFKILIIRRDPHRSPGSFSRSLSLAQAPAGPLFWGLVQGLHHSSGSLSRILVRILVKTPTTRPGRLRIRTLIGSSLLAQILVGILTSRQDPYCPPGSLLPIRILAWILTAHPDPPQDPCCSLGSSSRSPLTTSILVLCAIPPLPVPIPSALEKAYR